MAGIIIASSQMTISADVRANGSAIRGQMHKAQALGARLIHFPEGALSGYIKVQIKDWADVDWSAITDELKEIAKLAGELRIWVVVGCAHRLTAPNRPHNSLYIIDDRGELHGRYDKRFCSNTEINHWYTPGRGPVLFEVDGYRFGSLICIEIHFPELFAEYERLDIDCCLLSLYTDQATRSTVAQAHAEVNCFWVSMSVPLQCSRTLPSQIIGPDGVVSVAASSDADFTLIVACLDRDAPAYEVALQKARPWRRRARDGGIYRERLVDDPRSVDRLCW